MHVCHPDTKIGDKLLLPPTADLKAAPISTLDDTLVP